MMITPAVMALVVAFNGLWAGYGTGSTPTVYAEAMWTVPASRCSGSSVVAAWVGIDGYADQAVEQVGTTSGCGWADAWYENWPAPDHSAFPVRPGDIMRGVVRLVGVRALMTIRDFTSGASRTVNLRSYGHGRGAEAVAEHVPGIGVSYFMPFRFWRLSFVPTIKFLESPYRVGSLNGQEFEIERKWR